MGRRTFALFKLPIFFVAVYTLGEKYQFCANQIELRANVCGHPEEYLGFFIFTVQYVKCILRLGFVGN